MAKYTEKGTFVGTLTDTERQLISKKIEDTYNIYKIILISISVSAVLIISLVLLIQEVFSLDSSTSIFIFIIVLITSTALISMLYILMRTLQNKLTSIKQNDIKVYELTGILSKDYSYRGMVAYKIDNTCMRGETIIDNSRSKIQDYRKQNVTFQYIPELAKNKQFTDQNGKGYNFITDTFIG